MDIALACTGHPQTEISRLVDNVPRLLEIYSDILISAPPSLDQNVLAQLQSLPYCRVVASKEWSEGRHFALELALQTSANYFHYADLDRILHWVEKHPEELMSVVTIIPGAECTIIGRTEDAFLSHPLALQQTESIINIVFSHVLGFQVDLGGGSRGFSRRAVEYLMDMSKRTHAWCTDSEWVLLLNQAGFNLQYIEVDGLESPGYEAGYDLASRHWEFRTKLAKEIIEAGFAVTR